MRTGAANAWSVMSVDPERDLVFVPTSSPSPDFYGGERKGSNLYANAVVALRASTGTVVWSFQVVHHDLWDYDVASQPTLVTVPRDGRDIPAVVVGTKMGHLFVLHRETGEPLFPVEELPVPPIHAAQPGGHDRLSRIRGRHELGQPGVGSNAWPGTREHESPRSCGEAHCAH